MSEILANGIIVDSALTLSQALELKQAIPPSSEVLQRLGIVDVTYYSFDDKLHRGQLVLDKELIDDVKEGFDLITSLKFPVFSVIPKMDRTFMTDEEREQTVNNSVGFSSRYIAGKTELSNHSFGRAFDINPQINPYIKGEHSYGGPYDSTKPGTLTADDPVVAYFKSKGWDWGGDRWEDRKDYMHFAKPLPK